MAAFASGSVNRGINALNFCSNVYNNNRKGTAPSGDDLCSLCCAFGVGVRQTTVVDSCGKEEARKRLRRDIQVTVKRHRTDIQRATIVHPTSWTMQANQGQWMPIDDNETIRRKYRGPLWAMEGVVYPVVPNPAGVLSCWRRDIHCGI